MAVSSQSNLKKHLPWLIGGGVVLALGLLAALVLLYVLIRGNVVVTDLTLSQDSATLRETVAATVKLENRGRLNGKYHMVLLVDGQEKAEQDVTLKGRETRDIQLDLEDLPAGSHTVGIEEVQRDLRILTPAAFEVVSLAAEPDTCMLGESAVLKATIRNTGETAGNYTAVAKIDGASMQSSRSVLIDPGATYVMDIPMTPQAGAHTLELDGVRTQLNVLRPASITATELVLPVKYIQAGQETQLTVTLTNAGDLEGTYALSLLVNGKALQSQDVTVKGQETVTVPLTILLANTGKYDLKAGEAAMQTVYVVKIGRPNNGALLVKKANGGSGKLTLVNNYDQDAVFILASDKGPKTPLLSVYVRGKSKAANIKTKDGNYMIFYSLGEDFDTASKKFTKDAIYSRFTDPIEYKTSKSGGYIYYSTWTITLNTSEGNSPTDAVPEDQFPN